MNQNYFCNNGNYAEMGNYFKVTPRVFSQSTQPLPIISNWGGIPNNFFETNSGNTRGYSSLGNAYKQNNLFNGPYSARQCLGGELNK